MTLIRLADTRRTETPSGVMTTLASPSQGGAGLALWRVEMQPDIQGPVHLIDAEQIWTFLAGEATIELDGEKLPLAEGDTVILPADATRQVTAGPHGFTAIVTAPAGAQASTPGGTGKVIPPWIA
ncbi:cupin domain-containing protein [Streptosporangium sp. CA-135522]|uniref:cupin domain-containing protein n=1 Tax=Streptosporangium sp. CA-135522 TaxID=3240072 RepID=UPI003D8C5510